MTRLLWMTNILTPYRIPLWKAVQEQADIVVALLAETEPNRGWQLRGDVGDLPLEDLGARAVSYRLATPLYLPSFRLERLLAAQPRFDALVVDGWESPVFMQALIAAQRRGIPVVASYRSTLASHRHRTGPVSRARRWFFHRVNAVLTAGPASTEAVLSMGVPESRVVTGFNSVDTQEFARQAAKARANGAPSAGHCFLYVGQLIERKNIVGALRAFALMADADDTFRIVGTGPEGECLTRVAAELGVTAQVDLLGHLEGADLYDAYGTAHTFVLPSSEEVWGLVVNEALASGLHAVVSEAAGIVPSVKHMQGVFVTSTSAEAMAEQLRASRAAWQGPVAEPEMLQHTPESAAQAVLEAVAVAQRERLR